MDIFGVGPLELTFILLIALIVLGPNDMVKAGKSFGKFMRKIVTSPSWKALQTTSQELKNLPQKLIREAGLDEIDKELPNFQQIDQEIKYSLNSTSTNLTQSNNQSLDAWTTPANTIEPPFFGEETPKDVSTPIDEDQDEKILKNDSEKSSWTSPNE